MTVMNNYEKTRIKKLVGLPLEKLLVKANETRKSFIGDNLELCSIVNAKSGLCSEDCKFCAQSSCHKTGVAVYPLKSVKEIVKAALKAKKIGAKKFGIVTSGNKLNKRELDIINNAIYEIKRKTDIDVCGSLGALGLQELRQLKKSGLSRYHHNIETSRNFYPNIVSTHTFDERVDTIKNTKKAGLEICSGGIIGIKKN